MKAICKSRPAPGLEAVEVEEQAVGPGEVKLQVERGSVCGTDLHIHRWDAWAQSRIQAPRIIGHEFCGTVIELGEGVEGLQVGDFVASESHIVDPASPDYRSGLGHVDRTTKILGVDVDGGFRPRVVIPALNARPTRDSVPRSVAALQDALGNAVHTVMDGEVKDRAILITGLGPIGLFAAAICLALGARRVAATEVSAYRMDLARRLGDVHLIDPRQADAEARLAELEPDGWDAVLEMSGRPEALALGLRRLRPGGRISMLGLYPDAEVSLALNDAIFKGARLQGIVGRRLWQTWHQMDWLLTEKGLDVSPIITHELPAAEFQEAFQILDRGEAGKIVLDFTDFD